MAIIRFEEVGTKKSAKLYEAIEEGFSKQEYNSGIFYTVSDIQDMVDKATARLTEAQALLSLIQEV